MKTQKELEAKLKTIEEDERLHYDVAIIDTNAPLALMQLSLKTAANTLREVLELPLRRYHGKD